MKPNGRPGAEPGARGPEMKPNGDDWGGGGGYLDRPENETKWGGRGKARPQKCNWDGGRKCNWDGPHPHRRVATPLEMQPEMKLH